jgi:hypothetical protein
MAAKWFNTLTGQQTMPIDAKQVKWDSPSIDANQVKWDEPAKPKGYSVGQAAKDFMTIPRGVYRGFQDVTDTIAKGGASLVDAFSSNPTARAAVDRAIQTNTQNYQQDYGDSTLANVSRVGGNIAATLPVGGALAKGVSMIPGATTKVAPLIEGLRTGGMSSGNVGTRVASGAATGAAQSALIDPDAVSAGVGAALGGTLGGVVGKTARVAPQAVKTARDAGYTIPPTQAGGGIVSRAGEGLSGKAATAQAASVKNQEVTNALAAKAVGLPEDIPLTTEALDDIRKESGKAYNALASLPKVEAVAADSLMNIPGSKGFDPKQAVYDLRVARNDADAYYKSYGRTADPEALTKAKTAKGQATKLETELEEYAASLGQTELMPALRDARTQIAKTYTIQKALNPTSGSVDARVLAKELRKGKPLSGELKQAAEFAAEFPKAAQVMEKSGGAVALSPLDYVFAGGAGLNSLTGGGSYVDAAQNAAVGLGARNAARSLVLSSPVQNRLANAGTQSNALVEALRKSLARTPAAFATPDDPQSN